MTNIEYRTRDEISSPYEFLGQKMDDNPMKLSAKKLWMQNNLQKTHSKLQIEILSFTGEPFLKNRCTMPGLVAINTIRNQ